MKFAGLLFCFLMGFSTWSQDLDDSELDFQLFVLSLQMQDTNSVKLFMESDSLLKAAQWQLFDVDFIKAIGGYSFSDAEDSWMAGEPVKQLEIQYDFVFEDGESSFSGTTTVYLIFKESASGLKLVECFVPEGGEVP